MYARESFTIAEVADLLSIRRLSASYQDEFPVECPFCGDLRGKCSFCIRKNGELKNVYHCYHCGAAGNMLTLYAELSGIYGRNRYKEAYREISQALSFPGTDERQQSTTRNGFASIVSKKKRISLTEEELDYRDHVYKEMLTFLKLKETHRRNLLLRGLTLNEVRQMEERGFLSTDDENSVTIARKLLKKGFRLDGVPGFFINRDGDWEAAFYRKNNGYLCPVRDGKERIIGFQIRLDVPLKERKYLWFTSSGLERGTSSGSPAGMFGKIKDGTVYVTEGILKAEIAWMCTGNPYIGVPGVSNHKGLETVLRKLKEQAPDGYLIAEDVKFTVKDTGKVQKVKMKDAHPYGKLVIKKTDSTSKAALPGAEFELREKENGKVVEKLVTDKTGTATSGKIPIATYKNGKVEKTVEYILVETKAPNGYELSNKKEEIRFEYKDGKTKVIEIVKEIKNTKSPSGSTPTGNSPKTGDSTNIWLPILLAVLSACGIGGVIWYKKKKGN